MPNEKGKLGRSWIKQAWSRSRTPKESVWVFFSKSHQKLNDLKEDDKYNLVTYIME